MTHYTWMRYQGGTWHHSGGTWHNQGGDTWNHMGSMMSWRSPPQREAEQELSAAG
jgi:hypothetical protein